MKNSAAAIGLLFINFNKFLFDISMSFLNVFSPVAKDSKKLSSTAGKLLLPLLVGKHNLNANVLCLSSIAKVKNVFGQE